MEKLIQKIQFLSTRMETQLNSNPVKKEIDLDFKESKYATGRRKRSIARVWLKKGSGNIYINGKKMTEYFKKIKLQNVVCRPLTVIEREKEFDIKCSVKGGGLSGQAGAVRLGIARTLEAMSPDFRSKLKKAGMLTRDSRVVERQKPGQPGARKKFQFSKR